MQSYLEPAFGGFRGYRSVPTFSLYGDGRVIFDPAGEASRAGTTLASLVEGRLTRTGMRHMFDLALGGGLLASAGMHIGAPDTNEAPTTIFTASTTEKRHYAAVDAFGAPDDPRINEMAREDRRRITAFWMQLRDPASAMAASDLTITGPYEPTAIHLFIQPFEPIGSGPSASRTWPLADLATYGRTDPDQSGQRCVAVSGTDLTTMLLQLREPPDATSWISAGYSYRLSVDQLLPDESGVPCTAGEVPPPFP